MPGFLGIPQAEAAEEKRQGREQATVREAARLQELIQQYRERLTSTTEFFAQQAQELSNMHYQEMYKLAMQVR